VDWIHLGQDTDQWQAPVNMRMNLLIPYEEDNFLTSRVTSSFPRKTMLHGVNYS
jgi:hypothetical protein